jgi:hypothetical protein
MKYFILPTHYTIFHNIFVLSIMPYIHRTAPPKSNNVSVDNNTKYRLQVTAGPEYDSACHSIIPVNQQETVTFENDLAFVSLCVRVKNYRGK